MKNSIWLSFLFALLLGAQANTSVASDHIDGPVTMNHPVADLIDLYAFPTPGSQRSLTILLDLYPFVSSSGHFSEKVNYNIILRKASRSNDSDRILTEAASEVVISCKFTGPQTAAGIQMLCASNDPQTRIMGQIGFNQTEQPAVGNNITLFAGRRADPLILGRNFAGSYMKFEPGKPDSKNAVDNLNCLSIAMNVSLDQLFPESGGLVSAKMSEVPAKLAGKSQPAPNRRKLSKADTYLIAVSAESIAIDSPGSPPRRMDRIGRPEITNVTLNFKSDDPEVRDDYNSEPTYEVPKAKLDAYSQRIIKNVSKYDLIDHHQDWEPAKLNDLAAILLDDFLVVDPFVPCQESSFFEIERAMLLGQPHQSCGGRDPNDNAINKLYTLYEKGLVAMPSISINDGLSAPSKPVPSTFPYLAEPYDGPAAWLAEKLANLLKGNL